MFKTMENITEDYAEVEDYSISETSLEQVFISFAKGQRSTEDGNKDKNSPENHTDQNGVAPPVTKQFQRMNSRSAVAAADRMNSRNDSTNM